jgi:transcriptional regulator GlxA family with amidase domain
MAGWRRRRLRVGFILAHQFMPTAFSGFVDTLRLAADDGDQDPGAS